MKGTPLLQLRRGGFVDLGPHRLPLPSPSGGQTLCRPGTHDFCSRAAGPAVFSDSLAHAPLRLPRPPLPLRLCGTPETDVQRFILVNLAAALSDWACLVQPQQAAEGATSEEAKRT